MLRLYQVKKSLVRQKVLLVYSFRVTKSAEKRPSGVSGFDTASTRCTESFMAEAATWKNRRHRKSFINLEFGEVLSNLGSQAFVETRQTPASGTIPAA
jgi:hypothetical protein